MLLTFWKHLERCTASCAAYLLSVSGLKTELWYYAAEVNVSHSECVLCCLWRIFYILVLWLAEFWRILIKPVEYIMDEKATHPLLVGRKKPVLQSAIGDIKAERHEHSSTLKKWPCRPEGSKHKRHRPKKRDTFLPLFPPKTHSPFCCCIDFLVPWVTHKTYFFEIIQPLMLCFAKNK